MSDKKKRYVGTSGAMFVPGGRVDEVTIANKVKAGEWRLATEDEVSKFLGTHPATPAKREPRRPAKSDDE